MTLYIYLTPVSGSARLRYAALAEAICWHEASGLETSQ